MDPMGGGVFLSENRPGIFQRFFGAPAMFGKLVSRVC